MGKLSEIEPDVQQRIVEAARKVFTRKGFAGTSMREIADAAEVNKGLLHYYKWDKRKLFRTVFDEAFRQFAGQVNEIFDSDLPFFDKIEAFVDSYMHLLLTNPYLPAFVLSELNQHPKEFVAGILRRKDRPDPAKFLVQIQLEVQAGRIREVNPFHFFLSLLSMCVFPFLARPMVAGFLNIDDETYLQLLRDRKKEIVAMVVHALRI